MNSKAIEKIMSLSGPVVEVVILKSNGSIEQKKLDMTPKLNLAAKAIGAKSITIVGQLPSSQIVIMKNRSSEGLKKNLHIHGKEANDVFKRFCEDIEDDEEYESEHKGDLLLVKMNNDAVPEPFTKKNYLQYLSDFADGLLKEEEEDEEDEDDDEGDEDEEEEDEDDDNEEEDDDDDDEDDEEDDDEGEDEEEEDDEEEEEEDDDDSDELPPKVANMLDLILKEYKKAYKSNPTLSQLHKFIKDHVESETKEEAKIIEFITKDIEAELNQGDKKRDREENDGKQKGSSKKAKKM